MSDILPQSIALDVSTCTLCSPPPARETMAKICPACGSIAVERAFGALVRGMLRAYDPKTATAPVVTYGHRLTDRERTMLEGFGTCRPSPLTKWTDLQDKSARDKVISLPGTDASSIDLLYSPPTTLDFISEMEAAIASAARALRPSGVFVLGLVAGRLVVGASEPKKDRKLDPVKNKLEAHAEMWSMVVGRDWLISQLRKHGLTPSIVVVSDKPSDQKNEFFLGQKPAA